MWVFSKEDEKKQFLGKYPFMDASWNTGLYLTSEPNVGMAEHSLLTRNVLLVLSSFTFTMYGLGMCRAFKITATSK